MVQARTEETLPDWSARWLDRVSASNGLAVLALLLVSLLAFAPGFTGMPPMDRDEPRFAQASKQMLEGHDYIDIRFQTEARLKKPVGIYWLQAATVAAGEELGIPQARTTIALYRIPSFLAALGAVLLTFWTAIPLVGRRAGFLAALAMAGCILLGVEARLAKTDATLLLTILAMMGSLARLFTTRDAPAPPWHPLVMPGIFWTALAASILVKGPIGPLVVALAAVGSAAVTRNWRWLARLRWVPGLAWMLVLVSPWFVAIMVETAGKFLQQSVGNDMLAKVAGGQESHGAPPGLYLGAFWATFWPAAPFAALATPWVWRERRRPAVIFLLAWLVPGWLLFEAVPTKLPHYVLPFYPAIAILVGGALAEAAATRALWGRLVGLLVPVVAVALPVAALGAIWHYEHAIAWLVLPFGLLAILAAAVAWRQLAAGRAVDALGLSVVSAILIYWSIYWAGMPSLPTLWPSPRLAAAARSLDCPDPLYATAGYREPSLVFLVGTKLEMPDGAGAADFLAGGPCRMAFVDAREEAAFSARLAQAGTSASLMTRVKGLNINGGKPLDIGVYVRR